MLKKRMKIAPLDISKTSSASGLVFEALRTAIISGDMKEGEPLRQDELARHFNTSRIPIREALSRLEEQGLVKTQRYKGATVSGLSPDEAEEIFDFRALVEGEVLRRAVPILTAANLQGARSRCEDFASSPNPMEWGWLNRDFHQALYKVSGLKYHLDVIDNAMDRVDPYLRAQLVLTDGMIKANLEHISILDACEAGDAELAAERTRQHILTAKESLVRHLNSR